MPGPLRSEDRISQLGSGGVSRHKHGNLQGRSGSVWLFSGSSLALAVCWLPSCLAKARIADREEPSPAEARDLGRVRDAPDSGSAQLPDDEERSSGQDWSS